MSERFLDRYRMETARAKWWNYAGNGMYFITINTYNQEKFLSSIDQGNVLLTKCGAIIKSEWEKLPQNFSYVTIDEYVIMPNHFHGILAINHSEISDNEHELSVREETSEYRSIKMSLISSKSGSLPRVIGNFKSIATRKARKVESAFKWQDRYYDRIIRNETELDAIREYIRMNPLNWNK